MTHHSRNHIIINGDDFGLSSGTNQAIKNLHQQGKMSSASILANMPWSEDAFAYASTAVTLPVGIHLNLTTGRPLLPAAQVPTLVTSDGQFYDMPAFLSRFFSGRVQRAEIRAELNAQIQACLDSGLHPRHMDSHMHFHAVPALNDLISRLATHYGINTVRNPNLSAFVIPPLRSRLVDGPLRKSGVNMLRSTENILARRNVILNGPANRTDHMLYLRWCVEGDSDTQAAFRACIDRMENQTLEIIAHPAIVDEELIQHSNYVDGRQQELEFLSSEQFSQLLNEL
ncbi:MAG: ChbG/HpnK family deacetylase [Anaerolineales bacterium]|nr:ChbG/HpnK family deacetylase [Anaerolineales bacterium]MCB8991045.1 ChbG/HpnK family deacetylase [Ardenticatenaceae bacterium]MCB9004087.1 ChbG/HpnK family deacetylase [Ardenticatenaceae bacterium]